MSPELLPMLRPFREAVEWQLGRVPMTRKQFDALSQEAKLRAFMISGLTRRALVEEAYGLAKDAIAENLTKDEFAERLGAVLDKQEGLLLDARRIDLIAQNNTAIAYSSGRYRQLSDPELTARRPYWRYPLGPDDGRTSAICRKLQGFIARHDDPVWAHIFPPNHHNERHIQVTSLTAEQAEATGRIYTSGPEGRIGPVIEGQEILPDPGFDMSPGIVGTDDRYLVEAARAAGSVLPAKSFRDYGLDPFSSYLGELDPAPAIGVPIDPARLTDRAAYDAAWEQFREVFDIAPDATSAVVTDVLGDGVFVTRQTFEHLVGLDDPTPANLLAKHDRPRWFPLIPPTLEAPIEIWAMPRSAPDGGVIWFKRYLAAYSGGTNDARQMLVVAEHSREGWLVESAMRKDAKAMDRLRKGLLIYRRGA